ncbi:hypothetical protein [Flammeovirga sp. OC4]|uniref:acyltransferase n=1 Tax=Flammeovirga sp. OC4 TaxID=1382345 RepID=UPI00155DC285|nr:hypothetical protein [Flammeovirga sp. OC4]
MKLKAVIHKILRLIFNFKMKLCYSKNSINFLGIPFDIDFKLKGISNNVIIKSHVLGGAFEIYGNNNKILIEEGNFRNLKVRIYGDNHSLHIGKNKKIIDTTFFFNDNNTSIEILEGSYIGGALFVTAGLNNSISVGSNALFSHNIELWASDTHSIIDCKSQERLNLDAPIVLGDNIWLGSGVKVLKGVRILNNNIVGIGSIVSKSILENNVLSVGIPNTIVKRNIDWREERI